MTSSFDGRSSVLLFNAFCHVDKYGSDVDNSSLLSLATSIAPNAEEKLTIKLTFSPAIYRSFIFLNRFSLDDTDKETFI